MAVMTPKPGQPGNPGRPKGAKGRKNQYLESRREELLEKLVKLALRGDPTSMRLCIERLVPRLRAVATPLNVETTDDLATQGRELIRSALSGEASADVVRDMFAALLAQGNLVQLTEFERRIKQIEEQRDTPPWDADQPTPARLPLRGRKDRRRKPT